ncbi:MAG TPA: SprT family zinc-dependent metalloprotease [Patescibacteria group bacterium]|nr:SprT family zinc-dependent metalloprotease [Patescibacteria group bacterium]
MNQSIAYETKVSTRARRVRLSVYEDGRVVLTIPRRFPRDMAARFFERHTKWVEERLAYFHDRQKKIETLPGGTFAADKSRALDFVQQKIAQWNAAYRFPFKRVRIKNHKTKWGSCSCRGFLNFNFKILYLPEPLVDYLIVHELCHLREMNHGSRFWRLVEQTIPDYKERRRKLKLIDIK